ASRPRARRVVGGMWAAVLVLWVAPRVDSRVLPGSRLAGRVTPAFARVLRGLGSDMTGVGGRALGPPPPMRSNLARVSGADVFLIFLESYGAVSWQRPEFVEPLAASRTRLDADIRETGRSVVSAFVESTT